MVSGNYKTSVVIGFISPEKLYLGSTNCGKRKLSPVLLADSEIIIFFRSSAHVLNVM